MIKKISKIFLLIIILFSLGISRVYAESGLHYRSYYTSDIIQLVRNGYINYNWYTEGPSKFYANASESSSKGNYNNWLLHSVEDNGKYYIVYCLNPTKSINHNEAMVQQDNLNDIIFSTSISDEVKQERIERLKTLLLFGYNPAPSHDKSLSDLITADPKNQIRLIAMQILVWEIVEGGRTRFDVVEPDVYHESNSFYKAMVYPNGGSDPTKKDTLYYYYAEILDAANKADQANPSPAFDTKKYTMTWDSTNKKYTKTISGLGDYTSCTSDNNKVSVSSVTNSKVTVSSTEIISNAKITCKYIRGSGASNENEEEYFKHYLFTTRLSEVQDMVYGSGYKIFKKSFNVSSENVDIAIKKVDTENKTVSGAKFKLTSINNTSYSVVLDGNGSSKNIIYSGQYRVSETTVPKGFEPINDFNITINASSGKVTACDGERKNSNGKVVSCLDENVLVSYNNSTIELTIINTSRTFKILKYDSSDQAINGAVFEIRDANNNVVKFSAAAGNTFKYDTEGTITQITNNSHSYPISLLPEGEYKVVEVSTLSPYRLPVDEAERTIKIKIDSNRNLMVWNNTKNNYVTAAQAAIKVTNYTTRVVINKIGNGGALEGVQFELYNADKSQKIKCNRDSNGEYTYVDDQSSSDNSLYITNSNGDIIFNGLPEGTYYAKEVQTIPPYVLPTGDAVYTKIEVDISSSGVTVNGSATNNTIVISNTPNSFNFYKKDTQGNPLTTGKYKLQKYDKETNKYVDLKLVEVKNDGSYPTTTDVYKVDEKNGKIQFTLSKGVATFIDMESSTTYRIIETVAPEGYTKASTRDTAVAYIDEYGNASGLLVLVDQKIVKDDDSAYAELIINIQTGKERIIYAAVIVVVIGIIAGLIIYNRKK